MALPTKDEIARIVRDDPEAEFVPGNDSYDIVIKMDGTVEVHLNPFLFGDAETNRIERELQKLGVNYFISGGVH